MLHPCLLFILFRAETIARLINQIIYRRNFDRFFKCFFKQKCENFTASSFLNVNICCISSPPVTVFGFWTGGCCDSLLSKIFRTEQFID